MTQHVELDLSSEVFTQVEQAVMAGEFATASDAVNHALREWTEQRVSGSINTDALHKAWDEVDLNAPPGAAPEVVFRRLMQQLEGSTERSA